MARGSARSVEGVDIHAAIAAQKHLLHRCGGHPMAAGLSLDRARIDAFRRGLWRTLERMAPPPAEREIRVDAMLSLEQVSLDLAQAVERLAPFGQGNERPILATPGLTVAHSAVIGRTREHRRVVVRDTHECEQTVLWWRSTDQEVPEGRFDLAYTVGINTFRGQNDVQLTWVDARSVAPPVVRVAVKPTLELVDRRGVAQPLAALRALLSPPTPGERIWVWGEGVKVRDLRLYTRNQLGEGDTLVIWTAPPDPALLHAALDVVSPQRVVLMGLDPGLDAPRAFLERLGGLVKYALRQYGGEASLAALAAAMAHGERTVALGLRWMALRGRVDLSFAPGGQIELRAATRTATPDLGDERLPVVEGRLGARLEEAAAYREYFRQANKERVIQG
jgi:single-stranded-DNA-specific exonuclease